MDRLAFVTTIDYPVQRAGLQYSKNTLNSCQSCGVLSRKFCLPALPSLASGADRVLVASECLEVCNNWNLNISTILDAAKHKVLQSVEGLLQHSLALNSNIYCIFAL